SLAATATCRSTAQPDTVPITRSVSAPTSTSTTASTGAARAGPRRRPSSRRQRLPWPHLRMQRSDSLRRAWRMPELPEVEVLRRQLEKEFVGKRIKTVDVRTRGYIKEAKVGGKRVIKRPIPPKEFAKRVTDAKVKAVLR